MIFDKKKEGAGKTEQTKAVVGYDLGNTYAQISYWLPGSAKPETVSQIAGEEDYLIPAVLGRVSARDIWLFGRDAQAAGQEGQAVLVTDLLESACKGDTVLVGEESFDPVVLLSLFLKRSLSFLTPILPVQQIAGLVFTVETVSRPVVDALMRAAALLELPEQNCYVTGRAECFYYYNINQPPQLWSQDVLLCELDEKGLHTYCFGINKKTRPAAVIIDEQHFAEIQKIQSGLEPLEEKRSGMLLDQKFCEAVAPVLAARTISTIYLIGIGFEGEWYQKALALMCSKRRVFLGNNLYSKGACYAAMERLVPGSAADGYVFLGQDMIKANVGIFVVRRGSDAYLALLNAGTNWYDAKKKCDFLLEEEDSFSLRITPVDGRKIKEVSVTLTGLPKRPARTTRIRLEIEMTSVETVKLSMEDLGFGEFYPATHRLWEEEFVL